MSLKILTCTNTGLLQMVRQRGSFGIVNVTWTMVPASQGSNLSSTGGVVIFADGQQTADLTVDIIDDGKPSLDTLYFVTLVSVTQVSGNRLCWAVTLPANSLRLHGRTMNFANRGLD